MRYLSKRSPCEFPRDSAGRVMRGAGVLVGCRLRMAPNQGGRADGNRKQRGSRSLTARPVCALSQSYSRTHTTMKILMVAAENDGVAPVNVDGVMIGAKVGGIGDVVRDVPPAL